MGIYRKLLELQTAVRSLAKDASGGSYSFVSGNKLLSLVRPKMDALGLLLKQEVLDISNTRQDYEVGRGDSRRQKSEVLTTIRMKFTWLDVESGEIDENLFVANGMNDWDKGVGSALTYGERYFLLKFFHIATDEDDCDALNARREEEEAAAMEEALREEERQNAIFAEGLLRIERVSSMEELQSLYFELRPLFSSEKASEWGRAISKKKNKLNQQNDV